MAGGPDASVQRASVEKDASFNIYETWSHLFRNFLIVALVAATTWTLVTGVRYSIQFGSDYLFAPFAELYEEKEHEGRHSLSFEGIEKTPSTQTEGHSIPKPEAKDEQSKEESHDLTHQAYIIFIVLIVAALIRGLLLRIPSWQSSEGDGMARSLEFFHATYESGDTKEQPRYKEPDFLQSIRRAILTSLTVGSGGSGGIEAPVVPMGECIGAGWARLFKIPEPDDLRIYQMAGMSAAVATLLDAPMTSALFAAEIVYNARVLYRPLMYSLLGAIVAYALNNHFLNFEPLFTPRARHFSYSLKEYMEVCAIALICSAPASLGIAFLFKTLKKMIKPFHSILRPVIGAVCTGAIGLGIWFGLGLEPQHVLGVSEETIIQVMAGEGNPLLTVWWVLLLLVVAKAFATGFTLMAGGSAGALVPAMYLGGISGAGIYQTLLVLGYPIEANVGVFVVAGLASALVAVVQVPLAAIAFVMEVFGAAYGPPAIVACVLTYLFARRWKLYTLETN
tara:strand:- start:1287 stop:2807 length:1521 start_codon:yes stop_codon:yes gene_type:complete